MQVSRWRERYIQAGLAGIERDLPRGAPPVKVDIARLVELATQTKPEAGHSLKYAHDGCPVGRQRRQRLAPLTRQRPEASHRAWLQGLARSEVRRKARRHTGSVYVPMFPPERAMVLCCDEKSQVQALDRTQPGLPMKKARAATMTHDYKRNSTTTMFAALNVMDGQVIGQCQQHHTHIEWLAPDRARDAQGQDAASDLRQLRHAQASGCAGEAGQASALQHALHAHLGIVAEHASDSSATVPRTACAAGFSPVCRPWSPSSQVHRSPQQ